MGVYRQRAVGRLGRAAPPVAQTHTIPASVGGINALTSALQMPETDCLYAYNIMPSEVGLRLRKGYREWATNVGGEVRTIIPYEGVAQDASQDRLFAVAQNGIYNVSLESNTNPSQDVTFTTTTGGAGFGVYTEMTLDNGDQVLFYADEENGIHQYTEGGGWTIPAFTGVTSADIAFVTLHKQRLWVIEKNSGDAWYSPVAAIAGQFTKFTFGSKFTHGGNLMGLWSWTVDGGEGVDDLLVAISRGGDCLVYQGEDPALVSPSETPIPWKLVGSWFVGETPESRRLVVQWGGEMQVLSTFGITSLHDLLKGVDSADVTQSPAAKLNRFLRPSIQTKKDEFGWSMQVHPADGFLQIIEPPADNARPIQYNQNLLTKAWGIWRDVPMLCGATWNAGYYMGSKQGQVFINDGTLDNTTLAEGLGEPIKFDILTSFQPYGEHSKRIRPSHMRTVGSATPSTTSFNIKAVFDYNFSPTLLPAPPVTTGEDTQWDNALWDQSVWDGGNVSGSATAGVDGVGRTMAIAMTGEATSRIVIYGWDVQWQSGGFL